MELKSTYGMLVKRELLAGDLKGNVKGGNVGVAGKRVTLPHYMAMFLRSADSCQVSIACGGAACGVV